MQTPAMKLGCCLWVCAGVICLSGDPLCAQSSFDPAQPNVLTFPAVEARFVRVQIYESADGQPCFDELEVYGPATANNLALAITGARASASSSLTGYAIHQVRHLNDGHYGNSHSWIAATARDEWAQVELPRPALVDRVVVSRDRLGQFCDRTPTRFEIRVSLDGTNWQTAARYSDVTVLPPGPVTEADLLRYAFTCEDLTWRKIEPDNGVVRVLRQMAKMIHRFEGARMDVSRERRELATLRQRAESLARSSAGAAPEAELYLDARLAKRRLFFRDPQLVPLERILFVKRQPFEPSHNYSDLFDPQGGPGGAVCTLEIPRTDGRLDPSQARVNVLFDAGKGVARDPVASFDAHQIYFAYRRSLADYFHLWRVDADGRAAAPLTEGPFHDVFPCPLPDGGLAFMSTRCKGRYLCWRPQAFVLFRADADGGNPRALSHANLSEWTPSLMRDGRLLWMRSEYIDKGADFGHTLWAIRPDGTHPELIFGNNTPNCYAGGREVPGTDEILCTLVSHGGDLNGPLALITPHRGRFNPEAVRSLTPDVAPHYNMSWARRQCFRDPAPVSRDYFLCSHAPADKFGLYVIDRWGNRELLYLDPDIGSMAPTLLRATPRPPVLSESQVAQPPPEASGQFFVADLYRGLAPAVERGTVKYLRVCQEIRADLRRLPSGEYQKDHEAFIDWYATPIDKVNGPRGWPSYVAKADLGLAPVEADGSVCFQAPAGRVLYFQILDADFNELQRMRSVVQLQPGESRSCIGCHEHRMTAPPAGALPLAMLRPARQLEPPSWGAGPFAYEQVVQPVWDAHCVRCHDARHEKQLDLTARLDSDGIPASYRTLIGRGLVDYFDCTWQKRHLKADPLTFGTLRSPLWNVLQAGHHDVSLTQDERRRVKTWIDLNCPLWPDYQFRLERNGIRTAAK